MFVASILCNKVVAEWESKKLSGISIANYRSQLPWVANGGIAIDGTDQLTHVQIEYPARENK